MQDEFVALLGEELARHETEAVGRTGDQDGAMPLSDVVFGHKYRSPRIRSRVRADSRG
jgi:hypothetical protein